MASDATTRFLAGVVVTVVATGVLSSCSTESEASRAGSASVRLEDPRDDTRAATPRANAGRPPGIDLASADLHRGVDTLTLALTMHDSPDGPVPGLRRVWALRLWSPSGTLHSVVYAGDHVLLGGNAVYLCRHDDFCTDRSPGGVMTVTGLSVQVRVPVAELGDLPPVFEWAVWGWGGLTPNVDDDFVDYLPDGSETTGEGGSAHRARHPA